MKPLKLSRRMRAASVLAGGLAVAASVSSQAHAQAWLPDRAYTEGPGIRAGNVEIHPGVAIRGGYDSNVFRADGDRRTAVVNGQVVDVTQREQPSAVLAVTPHLHISTLSDLRRTEGEDRPGDVRLPAIAFRGGASATYLHYFRDGAPRNLEVDTDLWLGIMPQRPVNADVRLNYTRSIRPFTQFAGPRNAYDRNLIQPRLRINMGSRSQVLTSYIGYAPSITIFESPVFDYLNNIAHGVEAGVAWKFLPNTALIYDGSVFFQRYTEKDAATTRSPVLYAASTNFRTRLGLNGAFTKSLALRLLAGYGLVAFDDNTVLDEHEDVVGEAVLGWKFGPGQSSGIDLGYYRDLTASALGGWIRSDRGAVTLRSMLGRAFALSLEGGAGRIAYGRLWGFNRGSDGAATPTIQALGANGETHRKDTKLDGAVRAEYRATNWLAFMADFSVQTIITDFSYAAQVLLADRPIADPAGFVTWMAFGGVRVHY